MLQNYFWFFVVAQFFFEPLRVYANGPLVGSNPTFKQLSIIVAGVINKIINPVFLILGFWCMSHWWYPLIFIAVSFCIAGIISCISAIFEDSMNVLAMLGLVLSPIFFILAYLGMFGVL